LSIEEKQAEALKALADWGKWLVTLETTVGAALIAITQIGDNNSSSLDVHWSIIAVIFCFTLSILAAASLVGTVPHALQNLPIECKKVSNRENKPIYNIYKFTAQGVIPIWVLSLLHHTFAIFGVFFLVVSAFIYLK
jgi:hypothetical protein